MNKLGTGMIIASVLLFLGLVLYRFWQAGATDEIIVILIITMFSGGVVLSFPRR